MAKLVLMHRADSIYEDEPDTIYDFPKAYLKPISEAVGDWILYCEPVKAGPRGYFAVARISRVVPNPRAVDRYLALIEAGSFLPFDQDVPRMLDGAPLEASLRAPDGTAKRGGAQQLAVRRLSEADFARIVNIGLPQDLEAIEAARYEAPPRGADDPVALFERPVVERLMRRPYREVAFRRRVRAAYDHRCALSGLRLRNGGGRPEVQAAHIIPVEHGGSDSVRNGLALSGTLHWMFDRGLLSVADDFSILVSRNKVPSDVVDRLIGAEGKLYLPTDHRSWPHPQKLRWHRENVFGQVAAGALPWDRGFDR